MEPLAHGSALASGVIIFQDFHVCNHVSYGTPILSRFMIVIGIESPGGKNAMNLILYCTKIILDITIGFQQD